MIFVAAGAACIGAWAEAPRCCFCFRFPARSKLRAGRTAKEIRSLFRPTRRKSPPRSTPKGTSARSKSSSSRAECACSSKPGRSFRGCRNCQGTTARRIESHRASTPLEKNIATSHSPAPSIFGVRSKLSLARPAAESSLQKIVTLIKEASSARRPRQQFTDQVSTYYTYAALGLSFAMFFVWWLGFHLTPFGVAQNEAESQSAFYRTMTLLVVASRARWSFHSLAVLAAIAWGARHGILFRGGAAVEKLAEVNIVALDKTGTLTTGELRIEKSRKFPARTRNRNARLLTPSKKTFHTPAARAITRHGKQQHWNRSPSEHLNRLPPGLRAKRDGRGFPGQREWVVAAGVPPAVEPGRPARRSNRE